MPSSLSLRTYPHARDFLRPMRVLFEADAARNGLILGLALQVEANPHHYGDDDPYFATVDDDQGIAVAALMTPPHGVVLYSERVEADDALAALAHDLFAKQWTLPNVHGPAALALRFAQLWSELTGNAFTLGSHQRAFELRRVRHPAYSPGQLRVATVADRALVARWIHQFNLETHGEDDEERTQERVAQRITTETLFVWDNGGPVSLAGLTRPTERGISIGPVFTPPEQRGRGYASSAVARLSQRMLDTGKEFCTLFTDLANPTSNSIYQKIGYRPVGDFSQYKFSQNQSA